MSNVLHVEDEWKEILAQNKFNTYDDFVHENEYFQLVHKEKGNSVYKLKFTNSPKTLFLKINKAERPRKIFRKLIKNKSYKSPVYNEVNNIKYLNCIGLEIKIMKIAAWGSKTICGYPKQSFILTEEVKGSEFVDFYNSSNSLTRKSLYKKYGHLVGTLHSKQVDSAVRPQDLIVHQSNKSGDLNLALIDRELGSTNKVNFKINRILMEETAIFYQCVKKYEQLPITAKEALIFCKAYLESNQQIDLSPRELFELFVQSITKYLPHRKSYREVLKRLPKELFKIPA